MDKKKLVAISSAVYAYMADEENVALKQTLPAKSSQTPYIDNTWRMSGSREMMDMRRMIQLRFLQGGR